MTLLVEDPALTDGTRLFGEPALTGIQLEPTQSAAIGQPLLHA